MNFIKSTVITGLESVRDYLEQHDEDLLKRPKICVEYFSPKDAKEQFDSDKVKSDNNSTGSSDEKEGSNDDAATDFKKVSNISDCQ